MRVVPVLVALAACGEDPAEPEATACEGAGDPTLAVGTGGIDAFDPWSDGDAVATSESGGDVGIRLELLTTGLDTTGLVSVLITVEAGGSAEDALASVTLQCPSEGPGWIALFAPLPSEIQGDAVDGTAAEVTATATDQAGESASVGPVAVTLDAG